METYFIDTSFFIALEALDDQYRPGAVACWEEETDPLPELVTTRWVMDETVTFFNTRGKHDKAVEIGERMQASVALDLVAVSAPLFAAAWGIFKQYQDKTFSLTDCVSFALMQDCSIGTAFAFDVHFRQMGFRTLPETDSGG